MPLSSALFALLFPCFFCGANRDFVQGGLLPHAVLFASSRPGTLRKIYACFAVISGFLYRFSGGVALTLLPLVLLFYIQCHQMTALVSSVDQYLMAERSLIWYSLLEVRTCPCMLRLVV